MCQNLRPDLSKSFSSLRVFCDFHFWPNKAYKTCLISFHTGTVAPRPRSRELPLKPSGYRQAVTSETKSLPPGHGWFMTYKSICFTSWIQEKKNIVLHCNCYEFTKTVLYRPKIFRLRYFWRLLRIKT